MSCDDGLLFVGVDAGAAVTAFTPPDSAARLRPFIRFLRGDVQPTCEFRLFSISREIVQPLVAASDFSEGFSSRSRAWLPPRAVDNRRASVL